MAFLGLDGLVLTVSLSSFGCQFAFLLLSWRKLVSILVFAVSCRLIGVPSAVAAGSSALVSASTTPDGASIAVLELAREFDSPPRNTAIL